MKQWTQSRKTRVSPKGWVHGNAPCCVHNGETKDTRGRGGFKVEEASGGLVYSCFNCGFKAGYTPGRKLYHKTRRLMSWMGISENDINRMVIEAMRIRDMTGFVHVEPKEYEEPNFKERPLPPESLSIEQWAVWSSLEDTLQDPTAWPSGLEDAADYAYERFGEDFTRMCWTPDKKHAMNKRIIIPFTWKGKNVGFTARKIFPNSPIPKYHMEVDSDYVFGVDDLIKESEFVLVFEGPVDAILMNGVAVLSNKVSDEQADIIERLNKKVIVVPDLNKSGIPLINAAKDYGWSVSFPEWEEDVKDAGEAVQRYGKLFTLKSILSNVISGKLKIDLYKKRINE